MDLFIENLKFLAVCAILFVVGVAAIYVIARLIGYAIAQSWYETTEEQKKNSQLPNKQEENNGQEKK